MEASPRLRVLLSLQFCMTMCAAYGQSAPAPQPTTAAIDGVWLGTLAAGPQTLRLQLHLQTGAPGAQVCALDSLDQKAYGIPCGNVQQKGDAVSFEVPAVSGRWAGRLSPDGKTLSGTWTQGAPLPLAFARQQTALQPPKGEAPALEPAMPAVPLADLQGVLDHDLAAALKGGTLAPGTGAGVTIGVVQHGERRILTYGASKADSVFEIGSISKTFTGLILAQMVAQGAVQLDEPVRALLPAGTVAKPAFGNEIRLIDLSDQHSGLPRMPDNFHPADPANPYADYDARALYAFIASHGVLQPADAPFGYSNVGVGLLGQALANRAGKPYPQLLEEQVTGPLNMRDTSVTLTPEMRTRLIAGHDAEHHPAHAWDLDALAGAGGIRSTAADMLTYLEAQLHPDRLPATAQATPQGKTLPAAIVNSHTVHAEVGPGMHIALNWFRIDATGSYWHNGGTGGYSSYALFNPAADFALIVLSNTGPGQDAFTDRLGQHIAQRLSGAAALSLAP